jgi:hypothetical protein
LLHVRVVLGPAQTKLRKVREARSLTVQLGQRVERDRVVLVDVQRRTVRLDGLVRLLERTSLELRDGVEDPKTVLRFETVVQCPTIQIHPIPRAPSRTQKLVDRIKKLRRLGLERKRATVVH